MRVCAVKGTKVARAGRQVPPRRLNLLLGEDDDAAALGRLVGERGQLGGVGQALGRTPGAGMNSDGHAVAERDRAGLVEEEDVDVARGLDGAAAHREDVALEQPVHAGDADGAQEPADRRRDQADEEGDQRVIVKATLE
jgi:hypothetical protein